MCLRTEQLPRLFHLVNPYGLVLAQCSVMADRSPPAAARRHSSASASLADVDAGCVP
jgi:hypothetical protein